MGYLIVTVYVWRAAGWKVALALLAAAVFADLFYLAARRRRNGAL